MPRDAPRLPTPTALRPRRASLVARAPSEQQRHLPACRTLLADRLSGASPDSYCTCSCHGEPLGRPTVRVCATGNSVPSSFYRRPRASSAPCLGAPRTTDSRAPRSAGGVRIACTVDGGRRTAHAQRSATSLRLILLQFDGRAAAPMLAKRPRGSGFEGRAPHAKRLRSCALFWTDLPTRPGPPEARRTAGLARPDGDGSSFLGTAVATGGSARLPVRVLAWAIHTPSAAPGAAAGEEPGPEISPGEPSGPPRSSAPPLFPRVRMRGGR
eukprot:tig00001154_g7280.t1